MTTNKNTAQRWLATSSLLLATVLSVGCGSNDAPNGKDLYIDFCTESCHGIDNVGTVNVPPVQVATFQAIRNALDFEPTMNNIPELDTLSSSEIRAIADYIPSPP